ncbi:hypothetical protein [Konateibacter massiliensis]|uniref:hypothetical protein n=1 Tax=Konateibacter massiliensis TaxID=2002841 RepID=UPI000C15E35F|nr:hypothetical protein [Konateibacter massiliensis]
MDWNSYNKRLTINGTTQRDRSKNQTKYNILKNAPTNPSCKEVKLNGEDSYLIINTGTKPYYKEFESLPGQKILAGDYVEWANSIWLVYEADCDDEIYIDGNLRQCQYELFWQNADGNIVSRYAWVQNASAYNNGESGNNTITLQSNQFMVYIPYDNDTLLLDNGLRMHMSRSNIKCKPYELTRPDDIAYGYGEKGVLNLVFTQVQYNKDKDKLVELEDGKSVWICNYHSTTTTSDKNLPDETSNLSATISGNAGLKIGFARSYTVTFKDLDDNVIDTNEVNFEWNVVSGFIDKIEQAVSGNTIKLKVNDEELIGSSILLEIVVDGNVLSNIKINIVDVM